MPSERCQSGCGLLRRQLFLDTCGLAGTIAEVVQLGATNITTALHFDGSHQRGIGLESTLDAFARRNLANGEAGVQTTVTLGDDNAFVSLQTLAVTFLDLHLHDDGVAGSKVGNGLAQAGNFFLLELLNQVHVRSLKFINTYSPHCSSPEISVRSCGSSALNTRCASKSGRRFRVRASDCFSRQRRILLWSPDNNTSGTASPS